MSARMMPGNSSTWAMYRRGMMIVPGKSPPKINQCIQVPMTGMPIVMPDNGGAEAGAREQVVGERVAEEALEHRQDEQQRSR